VDYVSKFPRTDPSGGPPQLAHIGGEAHAPFWRAFGVQSGRRLFTIAIVRRERFGDTAPNPRLPPATIVFLRLSGFCHANVTGFDACKRLCGRAPYLSAAGSSS
jgi:hypothetical protein